MFSLLRVEWLKIKSYRTFWILLGLAILSIPGINYAMFSALKNQFPKVNGKSVLGSPFAFPDAWQTICWNSALTFIIPAILIITLTTNEFTFKTHRQNIIDGWSRRQFIAVKLTELVLLSIVCTLVVFLTVIVFGCVANKVPEGISVWQDSRFVFFYFVQMLSYSTIAFLLGLLIRRAGLAIAAFLGYLLAEQIVVWSVKSGFVDYLPEQTTDSLIPQPYLRKLLEKPEQVAAWEHHIAIYLVVALIYLLIYCVVCSRRFTTSDL